jgi:excisionase family DNA binding protein
VTSGLRTELEGTRVVDRLLSADEAAQLLGVSAYTVRQWARERRIPYVPLGPKLKRFRLASLLQWIEDHERAAR